MLKKISHIILSVLLLITTMGMTVSRHYCKGDLYSVSISGTDNASGCDMGNCCHDEIQNIKITNDFSVPSAVSIPILAEFDILGQFIFEYPEIYTLDEKDINFGYVESPPLLPIIETLSVKQEYLL